MQVPIPSSDSQIITEFYCTSVICLPPLQELFIAMYIKTHTHTYTYTFSECYNVELHLYGELLWEEFFTVSVFGCTGHSSVGVTTNGTSILWLRSNSANIVRNCEDGVTSRSCKLVHKDNAPLQSPRRPITILYLPIFKLHFKDIMWCLMNNLKNLKQKVMQLKFYTITKVPGYLS